MQSLAPDTTTCTKLRRPAARASSDKRVLQKCHLAIIFPILRITILLCGPIATCLCVFVSCLVCFSYCGRHVSSLFILSGIPDIHKQESAPRGFSPPNVPIAKTCAFQCRKLEFAQITSCKNVGFGKKGSQPRGLQKCTLQFFKSLLYRKWK